MIEKKHVEKINTKKRLKKYFIHQLTVLINEF